MNLVSDNVNQLDAEKSLSTQQDRVKLCSKATCTGRSKKLVNTLLLIDFWRGGGITAIMFDD